MASAAPPNRVVSSVFITLASPYRATLSIRDRQHGVPVLRHSKEDVLLTPSESETACTPTASPLCPKPAQNGTSRGQRMEEDSRGQRTEDRSRGPAAPSSPQTSCLPEKAALPSPPAQISQPLTSEVETGSEPVPEIHKKGQDTSEESKEVCGFCRKPMSLCEPAIVAMNRTYHKGCFQCRSCRLPLAGQQYYNKAGTPLCEDCYQASLELCWRCGDVISDHVIRALERAYHPTCFTCTTCKQQIGEQAFALGEVGDVYCLQDYYRKYAPRCSSCQQLIIPREDGTDSYTVECLGRSYHENCYRCEVCMIQLSPEPNERGCHPLDGRMLCRTCHQDLVSSQI